LIFVFARQKLRDTFFLINTLQKNSRHKECYAGTAGSTEIYHRAWARFVYAHRNNSAFYHICRRFGFGNHYNPKRHWRDVWPNFRMEQSGEYSSE
jgi:hypothetical protein